MKTRTNLVILLLAVLCVLAAVSVSQHRAAEQRQAHAAAMAELDRVVAEARQKGAEASLAKHTAFTNCLNARVQLFEFYQKLGLKPKDLEPCGHDPKH